jgi:hypothetical protein
MDHEDRIKRLEQRTTGLFWMRLLVILLLLSDLGTQARLRNLESRFGVAAADGWANVRRSFGWDRPLETSKTDSAEPPAER